MSKTQKGYLFMIGFAFFTSFAYIGTGIGFRVYNLSVFNSAFWGFFGALFLSLPYFFATSKRRISLIKSIKENFLLIFLLGITTLTAVLIWFWVISESESGIVSLLDKSEVLWALFFGVLFLGEKISKQELFGLSLAAIGIICISTLKNEISFFVASGAIFTSFLYALQSFLFKKYTSNPDAPSFAFWRGIILLIFVGTIFFWKGKITFIPLSAFFIISFAQLSGLLVGRALFFEAHKYLEVSKLNVFQLLVPVFVLGINFFLFPEDAFSFQKITGAFCILLGLFFFLKEHFRHPVKRG